MIAAPAEAPFRARFPWLGPDLQTVRNWIVRPRPDFSDAPPVRLSVPLGDPTGDALVGELHRLKLSSGRPLAVLVHGLTGSADSAYVLVAARNLLDRGYPVLRLNLRGAGPSAGACREQYHAGRSEDLRRAFSALVPEWGLRGMVAVGYSLGGNILLKYLGEEGPAAPLIAAATVSAPIDLAATAAHFHRRRNRPYLRHILGGLKAEVRASRGGLAPGLAAAVAAARDIVAFDDTYVAPRYGFASAADYYARSSAIRYLGGIAVPVLAIQAGDDSWVPAEAYRRAAWPPSVRALVAPGGGHVGFHGKGGRLPWHDRRVADFFAGAVGARRDRPPQPPMV